jgi:hypothetical protein
MKITTTWLESRREPRNRPKERYDETADGREGLIGAGLPERRSELPVSLYERWQAASHGARRIRRWRPIARFPDALTRWSSNGLHFTRTS